MTVHRRISALVAAFALLLGAGCRGGDTVPEAAEVDEAGFRTGQQRLREGLAPEALTWFLKVIEKRGVQNAAESHLEAGRIYLQYIKDPIEAYHHFRKYLELQPNSQQAGLVRQQVDAAIREFATRLPLRPEENQVRFENNEELARLRREIDELRAENATLRAGGAASVARSGRMISAPAISRPVIDLPVDASPITPAPTRSLRPVNQPSAAQNTAAATPTTSGRTHTVERGESAWAIARKYYGPNPAAVQVQAILDANRITGASLKPGMVLRIP